jgi:hypothetical protein
MHTTFLNMVWPALYVSSNLSKFWWLVFVTILVEAILLRYWIRFTWLRSFLASLVGNVFSAFVGTIIMLYAMIIWHAVADPLFDIGTFAMFNWVMTYILMCLGSAMLETWLVKWIFKEKFWRLFWPMLSGNVITYIIIVVTNVIKR